MKIGFIGCGNMGGAILQGILQGGTPAADIYVADLDFSPPTRRIVRSCRTRSSFP